MRSPPLQVLLCLLYTSTVYVPLELLPSVEVEKYRGRTKFAAVLPRVWRTADEEGLREQLRTAKERGVECAVLGNLGHLALVRALDVYKRQMDRRL